MMRNRLTDPAFRRAVERIHDLGPRALGEMLIELDVGADVLARYARLDPEIVRALDADHWPVFRPYEVAA